MPKVSFLTILLFIGLTNALMGQWPQMKIDSLKIELLEASEGDKAHIYQQLGTIYSYNDSVMTGILFHQKAQYFAKKTRQEQIELETMCDLGFLYQQIDDIANAQIQLLNGYFLSEKLNNQKLLLHCASILGDNFNAYHDYANSRKYIKKAILLSIQLKADNYYMKSLNAMGISYRIENKMDSAEFYINKFISYGVEMNDSLLIGIGQNNLADLKIETGQYLSAIVILNNLVNNTQLSKNKKGFAMIFSNLGNCYFKTGNFQAAILNIQKSNSLSVVNNFQAISMINYKMLSDLYRQMGNLDSALINYEKYTAFKDSIFNIEKQKNIQKLMIQNQQEHSEKQISIYKQKALIRSLYLYFTLFIILLLFIISIQFYRSFKLKIKLQEIERKKMCNDIDQKNRQLVSQALDLSQKKQLISNVEDLIKNFKEQSVNNESKNMVDDINSQLKVENYLDNNWKSFTKHFEEVHPSFFKRLETKHTNLTNRELKQCAFIKLNLGIKEVAIMNGINVRSVQMIRYRLKKKLKLLPDDDLDKYIHQF